MVLNLLLTSSLFLMSDCDHFFDVDKISHHTEVDLDSASGDARVSIEQIKGKKILLLVHGFNNPEGKSIPAYRLAHEQISTLKDANNDPLYDVVVGYLWPGYEHTFEYFLAKDNARHLAEKLKSHLEVLSDASTALDIMAHSMGNYLVLQALNYPHMHDSRKLVANFFSMAAAVEDKSIEKDQKFDHSIGHCQDVFVFYSKNDEVLKWAFRTAELVSALGYCGAKDPKDLPGNVELIDCSSFIHAHGEYFTASPIYEFIHKQRLLNLQRAN